jgi:hypothetical protein
MLCVRKEIQGNFKKKEVTMHVSSFQEFYFNACRHNITTTPVIATPVTTSPVETTNLFRCAWELFEGPHGKLSAPYLVVLTHPSSTC